MTPSQRHQSWLRERGYKVGLVERFIHPTKHSTVGHRQDLFGCIDMLALKEGEILAVQSTGQDWAGHWKKLTEGSGRAGVELWLATGQPFLLIGWRKLAGQGYQARTRWLVPADLKYPPV